MFLLCTTVSTTGYVVHNSRRHTQTREREKTCENESTSLLLGMPRRRLVHDPCAYQRPSEHTGVVDRYLTMYHALGFFQIQQMGVL